VNKNRVVMHTSKPTYYNLLGLEPSASMLEIRCAYKRLSKCYHPDTTVLPISDATVKFQHLNEAYTTLMNLEDRYAYDLQIGYSKRGVIESPVSYHSSVFSGYYSIKSRCSDPSYRSLSSGEIFALFILSLTFLGCLMLVLVIGIIHSDLMLSAEFAPLSLNIQ